MLMRNIWDIIQLIKMTSFITTLFITVLSFTFINTDTPLKFYQEKVSFSSLSNITLISAIFNYKACNKFVIVYLNN